MEKLNYIKRLLMAIFVFLLPLFFLTTTSEFYATNKFYLLVFVSFVLLVIQAIEIFAGKKAAVSRNPIDVPFAVLLVAVLASTLIISPNKIQALLNFSYGFTSLFFIFVFYLFVSRSDEKTKLLIDTVLFYSSSLVSVLTLILLIKPFTLFNLPASWQFLNSPYFTTVGSFTDLIVLLGFSSVYRIARKNMTTTDVILLALNITGFAVSVFNLFKPSGLALPPFGLSWFAGLEILKNPLSALFGIGVDNYSVAFARVKDVAYNQSSLWQVNSFTVARSVILHVLTETGIFGLAAFAWIIYSAAKVFFQNTNKLMLLVFGFWILVLLLLPVTFPTLLLFFLSLGLAGKSHSKKEYDFSQGLPYHIAFGILTVALVGVSGYFLSRAYASEYYFKKSINGLVENNVKKVYDNMRTALIYNAYNEKVTLNFSQTNLIIANNLSQKKDLTENNRQTIAQAIQASISEGKALVKLNPNKAQYWENLANIYRVMIPLAQGSEAWTISVYQRAIILDPQNPSYRMALGSVYYLLKKYPEATSFFEQAVALKPDWANGYYNLAWTYYQSKDYQKATLAMKNVVSLLNKNSNPKDWEKANTDLEKFKQQLPSEETSSSPSAQLTLPTPMPTIEPKIELPREASPEASQP